MAIGITALSGPRTSYTEDFLPDDALRDANSAIEGAFISHILVYEVILSEVIPREEKGRIAGEHISDNGVSPWVGREL